MKILEEDTYLEVPEEIAVCPICKAKLFVYCEHWEEHPDGAWIAASINMECETEPDIDSEDWNDWFSGHYSMPYVDWLPVEQKLLVWINKNYRWHLE